MWSMLGLIFTCFLGSFTPPDLLLQLAFVLFLFNLLTSTQDIAVDGIAIQVLSHSELAYGNIAQVVGYKFGAIFGGGILTWLSDYLEWSHLFIWIAAVYGLSLGVTSVFVPSTYRAQVDSNAHQSSDAPGVPEQRGDGIIKGFLKYFLEIFKTPGTKWMAVYVLLYKLGSSQLHFITFIYSYTFLIHLCTIKKDSFNSLIVIS